MFEAQNSKLVNLSAQAAQHERSYDKELVTGVLTDNTKPGQVALIITKNHQSILLINDPSIHVTPVALFWPAVANIALYL